MDSGLSAVRTVRSDSTRQEMTGVLGVLEKSPPEAVSTVVATASVAHVMRAVCVTNECFMDEPFILYQKLIWWVVDGAIVSPTPISVVIPL